MRLRGRAEFGWGYDPQPIESPADRDQPDHFEYEEDYVGEPDHGSEGLTQDAHAPRDYAQISDPSRKDASQHDQRDDQDADLQHDAGEVHSVGCRNQTLSGSREGQALRLCGGCSVLIAQEY